MLLDSTVFIDFIRGYKPAVEVFEQLFHGQSTSVLTKLELIVGIKSKKDIKSIETLLRALRITVLPITEEVSNTAETILVKFYHSHRIGMLDSFIAATALVYDEELITSNKKHFDFIPDLKLLTLY